MPGSPAYAMRSLRRCVEHRGDLDLSGVLAALHDYTGRLRCTVDVPSPTDTVDRTTVIRFRTAIVLAADDHTDLGALRDAARNLAERSRGRWLSDLDGRRHRYRALRHPLHDDGFTLPELEDGALVVFAGNPLPAAVEVLERALPRLHPNPAATAALLSLQLDAGRLLRWLRPLATAVPHGADLQSGSPLAGNAFGALGLDHFGRLAVTVRIRDGHLLLEAEFGADTAAGPWPAIEPGASGLGPGTALLGSDTDLLCLGTLRADRLWQQLDHLARSTQPGDGATLHELEQTFVEQNGVRLHEDLLTPLGDRVLLLGRAAPPSLCAGWSLRDPQALRRALASLLSHRQLTPERTDRGGTTLAHLATARGELSWTVTCERLLVSLGQGGRTLLAAAAAHLRAPAEPIAGFARRLALAGDGDGLLAVTLPPWLRAWLEGPRPPRRPVWRQLAATVADLLPEHHLARLIAVGRWRQGGFRVRAVW